MHINTIPATQAAAELHQAVTIFEGLVANVAAAADDDAFWVVKDNATWARQRATRILEAAAEMYVTAKALEEQTLRRAVTKT